MNIEHLLQPSRCQAKVDGASKKRALELSAEIIAKDFPILTADYIFRQLLGRERLGSTGLGNGIAIPHCRVENCTDAIGCLYTLNEGIDFESIDGEKVSLIFTLVVPEEANDAHINMLANLAKVFNNPNNVKQLCSIGDSEALYQSAVQMFSSN